MPFGWVTLSRIQSCIPQDSLSHEFWLGHTASDILLSWRTRKTGDHVVALTPSHSYSKTNLGPAVKGFCRCDWSPGSVDFMLSKAEIILGRPDFISWKAFNNRGVRPSSLGSEIPNSCWVCNCSPSPHLLRWPPVGEQPASALAPGIPASSFPSRQLPQGLQPT